MMRNLIIKTLVAVVAVVAVIMISFIQACDTSDKTSTPQTSGMTGMTGMTQMTPPPVNGYAEGMEILFIHTEASDAKVAKMLTDMMGSPVLVVPSLTQASESMLANVYAFTNGIKGEGPLGFQPDVFDSPPGTTSYTPLRSLIQVAWKDERSAHVLKSAATVKDAEFKGQVTLSKPGVVINMPMLTWPGGKR